MSAPHNKPPLKPAATPIPPSLQAKLAAAANRANAAQPTSNVHQLEYAMQKASLGSPNSSPAAVRRPPQLSPLAQRIQNLKANSPAAGRRLKPGFSLADIDPNLVQGQSGPRAMLGVGLMDAGLGAGRPTSLPSGGSNAPFSTPFANFSKIVDPSGALNFNGKAILNASGVNFQNGASFAINMDQLQLDDEELGKGNYGTVKKVLHKPTNVAMAMKEIRLELDQAKLNAIIMELDVLHRAVAPEIVEFYGAFFIESCVYYCMEYMDAGSLDKLIQVAPSDPLQTVTAPRVNPTPTSSAADSLPAGSPPEEYSFALPFEDEVIDVNNPEQFEPYNAAFNRSSSSPSSSTNHTYNGGPIPEAVLGRIANSMVRGLKFLKDELNIIHRDVKPTNVLINRRGQVKLCDFGVSGQLDKSMARTNIGCQSYMAPERIRGESRVVSVVLAADPGKEPAVPGTAALADELYGSYTVSSDVWSLGLSIIELGLGRYPYPPETYSNVFAQLTAIVHGPPPCLPSGPPPPPPISSNPASASGSAQSLASSTSSSSSSSSSSSKSSSEFSSPSSSATSISTNHLSLSDSQNQRPGFSPLARDWTNKCMKKEPGERATYRALLEHPWLTKNAAMDVDVEGWVRCACEARERIRARGK